MAAPDNSVPETTTTGFRVTEPPTALDFQTGYQPNLSDLLKQQHAKTASKLAGWLVWILTGSIVVHYVCVMVLIILKRDDAVKIVEDALHSWLPVLAGLAGGAATYYFTKETK